MTTHSLIVLEGCDGVGKTTLAKLIAEEAGYQLVHSNRTPEGVDLFEHYERLISSLDGSVLDRCFVSELVYGEIFRDGSRLSTEQAIWLAQIVAARSGLFVYLRAAPLLVYRRLQTRGSDDAWSVGLIEQIQAKYEAVFAELEPHAPVVRYAAEQAV